MIHQLRLELPKRTIKLAPCRTSILRHLSLVGDFTDGPKVLAMVIVFSHHDLHGHVRGSTATGDDERKKNLFFFGKVVFDIPGDPRQQFGESLGASGLFGMGCLDFGGQPNEPGQFGAKGRMVPVENMLNQFGQRTLVPAGFVGFVTACRLDGRKHRLGVQAFFRARIRQR